MPHTSTLAMQVFATMGDIRISHVPDLFSANIVTRISVVGFAAVGIRDCVLC